MIFVVLLCTSQQPYVKVHLGYLSESGGQLVGLAAYLTFESTEWC